MTYALEIREQKDRDIPDLEAIINRLEEEEGNLVILGIPAPSIKLVKRYNETLISNHKKLLTKEYLRRFVNGDGEYINLNNHEGTNPESMYNLIAVEKIFQDERIVGFMGFLTPEHDRSQGSYQEHYFKLNFMFVDPKIDYRESVEKLMFEYHKKREQPVTYPIEEK